MRRQTTEQRVIELEREVEDLKRQVRGLASGANVNVQATPRVRLAKCWTESAPAYPDNTHVTLPIVFLDGDVDQSAADTTPPTFTHLSADASHYATTIDNSYVARGEVVWVLEQNRKWWILQPQPGEQEPVEEVFIGTLAEDVLVEDVLIDIDVADIDDEDPIEVLNSLDLTGATGDAAIVWRKLVGETPEYRLVALYRRDPVWIKGGLDSDMCSGTGVDLNSIVAIGGFPTPTRSSYLNSYVLHGTGSTGALAAVDVTNEAMTIAQVGHVTVDLIDEFELAVPELSASTKQIQVTKCDTAGSDIDVLTFTQFCPGVGLSYSDPTLSLEFDCLYAIEDTSTPPADDDVTFVDFECP